MNQPAIDNANVAPGCEQFTNPSMTTPTDQQDREQADRTANIRIAEAIGYWFYKESTDINTRVFKGSPSDPHHDFIGLIGSQTAGPSPLPDWFHDANAALSICDFMRAKGYSMSVLQVYNEDSIRVSFFDMRGNLRHYRAECPALAQAICRAFIVFLDAQNDVRDCSQRSTPPIR